MKKKGGESGKKGKRSVCRAPGQGLKKGVDYARIREVVRGRAEVTGNRVKEKGGDRASSLVKALIKLSALDQDCDFLSVWTAPRTMRSLGPHWRPWSLLQYKYFSLFPLDREDHSYF